MVKAIAIGEEVTLQILIIMLIYYGNDKGKKDIK